MHALCETEQAQLSLATVQFSGRGTLINVYFGTANAL